MACCTHPVRLSRSNAVLVDRCGCGTVHITLGHTTLHIDEASFFAVARELHQAASRLADHHARDPLCLTFTTPGSEEA